MKSSTKIGKTFIKAICLLLVLTLFISMFALDTGGIISMPEAEALSIGTGTDGVTMEDKVSDIDTSNFMFVNENDVGSMPGNYQFVNKSANDGRIWTDKSVNASQAFIYDSLGGVAGVEAVTRNSTEFLVTYSALSQTINTTNIIIEPSDTVFVIDVSGSMASNNVPGDGRSRAAVIVEALNNAIKMLMDANPDNRISVVIYGGQSVSGQNYARAQPVLALGRYDASTAIFSMSGTSTVTVRSNVSAVHSSFTVEGGTPTQLGMRRGAQVLLGVPRGNVPGGTQFDTGIAAPGGGSGNIIVTRQPNIILMTDGEPTYAWTDYRLDGLANIDGTDFSYNVGNGSAGDMGLTALTVMTASYVKKLVQDWYYPTTSGTPGYSPDNATKNVGFYTIGLGVNSAIANGMLDPYGNSASGVPNAQLVVQGTKNMLTVLDDFAPGSAPVTFPALSKGSSTNRPDVTVSNTGGVVSCNYDTLSFSAMDKAGLDDAFNTITQQIVNQGNYSTNAEAGREQFSGYLTFSDVIGEYMLFRQFRGLYYNNTKYTNVIFTPAQATAFTPSFVNQMQSQYAGTGAAPFTATNAGDVLTSSINAANNPVNTDPAAKNGAISYYTNNDRVYLTPVFSPDGSTVNPEAGAAARVDMYVVQGAAVDTINGNPTNLNTIIFQVITTLAPTGQFSSSGTTTSHAELSPTLVRGDQIVRWYVPGDLIPMRAVEPVLSGGNPTYDDFGNQIFQVAESVPLRVIYTVIPDFARISNGLTATYSNVNPGTLPNSYFFYTNRWRGTNGVTSRTDLANMSLAFFVPHANNTYYSPSPDTRGIPKTPVPVGPTGTSPFSWDFTHFNITTPATTYQVQRLGNNGRIMLQSQIPIKLYKTFNFDGPPPTGLTLADLQDYPPLNNGRISMISFVVVGLDPAGQEIYRNTLYLRDFQLINTATEGSITIEPNTFVSADIFVPPGDYTFAEAGGFALGFARDMLPGTTGHYPTPIGLNYAWLANAYTNETVPPDPGIYLQKAFHGLRPSEIDALGYTITLKNEFGSEWGPWINSDFTFGGPGSAYGVHIPATDPLLVPGKYWLEETNVSVPGFVLETIPNPLEFTLEAGQISAGFLFTANNVYSKPKYNLGLEKYINPNPLVVEQYDDFGNLVQLIKEPLDLAFKIEGVSPAVAPPPPPPTVTSVIPGEPGYPGTEGYLKTILWTDLVNNKYPVTLFDITPGDYTITEIGGNVPGYTGPSITVTQNGSPIANGGRFTLPHNANANLAFAFTNIYTLRPPPPTLPPPPPDKAPQTGVSRNVALPITLLSISAILFGGAEVIRRRYKQKSKK